MTSTTNTRSVSSERTSRLPACLSVSRSLSVPTWLVLWLSVSVCMYGCIHVLLTDELRDTSSSMSIASGAPDPTFGDVQGGKSQWQLSKEQLERRLTTDLQSMTRSHSYMSFDYGQYVRLFFLLASTFDSNSNQPFRFDSKVTGRFEIFWVGRSCTLPVICDLIQIRTIMPNVIRDSDSNANGWFTGFYFYTVSGKKKEATVF